MNQHIKTIQTLLKDKGLYVGDIDGIAGNLTVRAVEQALGISDTIIVPKVSNAKYKLSERSMANLKGVHPDLAKTVQLAIQLSDVDFTVIEGLRTKERQAELVRKGASKTMNSYHLTGNAVDIVPIVNGQISWVFEDYYPMVLAMQKAAKELGTDNKITWGGSWNSLAKSGTPQEWVEQYKKLKKSQKKDAFLDGPHFEIK